MLPKKNRINLKTEFTFIRSGKQVEDDLVKLLVKIGKNTIPRIGISTSAKVHRLASDRNRARRLVSKAFENLYQELPESINIIALPKSGVLSVSSDKLTEKLKVLLKQVLNS